MHASVRYAGCSASSAAAALRLPAFSKSKSSCAMGCTSKQLPRWLMASPAASDGAWAPAVRALLDAPLGAPARARGGRRLAAPTTQTRTRRAESASWPTPHDERAARAVRLGVDTHAALITDRVNAT